MVGKPAHDTRLVAAMRIHGLTSILTLDKTGFTQASKSSIPPKSSKRPMLP